MFKADSHILIVDDDDSTRAFNRHLLSRLGFQNILEAENGSEALELVKRHHLEDDPFDLILLDWNMPVMNGIDLLVEIQANTKLRSIPILIVTVENDVKQVVQVISAGAADFIVKPITCDMLLDKLQVVWNRLKATTPKATT